MITDEIRKSPLGSRTMTEEELNDFLKRICYGTISYIGDDGWPDARPMNLAMYNGNFYFHANKKRGEKLKHLCNWNKICISFYEVCDTIGQRRMCQHNSVLVYGKVEKIDEMEEYKEEMYRAMIQISFAAGTAYKGKPERLDKSSKGVGVFKIIPEHISGKVVMFTSLPE